MMVLVFAGSYKEYKHLMQTHKISHLHKDWRFVSNVSYVLPCLRNTPYVLYGTWFERPDCERFLHLARGKNFIRVEPIREEGKLMKTMMQAVEEARVEKERLADLVPDKVHDRIMKDLQKEWLGDNLARHQDQRRIIKGIRSSQISALVMYLIQKGVLK